MSIHRVTRRTLTATAAGIATGLFATSRSGDTAQEATPIGDVQATGFVSTRVRTAETAE